MIALSLPITVICLQIKEKEKCIEKVCERERRRLVEGDTCRMDIIRNTIIGTQTKKHCNM